MALSWPDKDPNERLDFHINWSNTLDGDTITASDWIVPTGITQYSESATATVATVWLESGTEGERYSVLNRITTAGGRIFDQTVRLRIKSS